MSRIPDVRPVDLEVGDDDDQPGISLELTYDDIEDIAYSPDTPLEERIVRLEGLRADLQARSAGDLMGDMSAILETVEEHLASLHAPADTDGALDSVAMDTSDRTDDDDPADLADLDGGDDDEDTDADRT